MTKSRSSKPRVAYFCMEYGLDSALKIYAGGLGILAGDTLKAAHDRRLPMVGVGLKWKQGYVEQFADAAGRFHHAFRTQQFENLEDTGVEVTVSVRRRPVRCKVWKVTAYGNAPLYLLDADVDGNVDRWITGQLYGWFSEERIAQEMLLGIGGVRALRALGFEADVYHFNEGHAVFAGLEFIREHMGAGESFTAARAAAREKIVFTTHTPIPAGNESHRLETLAYVGATEGLSLEQMVTLGGAPFNMTAAALRLARKANAVARLHGETANAMWRRLNDACEIIAITNGIHRPTWVDPEMLDAAESGKGLWKTHIANKNALLDFIEQRTGHRPAPDVLTIGFARRMAGYKRNDFIFRRKAAIEKLLRSGKVQLVFSGKAHPQDDSGNQLAQRIEEYGRKWPGRVVFLRNYDMEIGRIMTRGVDVWLNNPVRPNEACGTSGMKAAMNGVLNLSTLDGWWPEACRHGINGWGFGDGFVSTSVRKQDAHDLKALYRVLQEEVIPTFYDDHGKWVRMMRSSIRTTRERFSAARMIDEYYDRLYASAKTARDAKRRGKSKGRR